MEQARWAVGVNNWTLRGGSEGVDENVGAVIDVMPVPTIQNNAVSLSDVPEEQSEPMRDWAATLDLVQVASSAMRGSEARIAQLEAEAERQRAETRSEMEALQAQLRLAQREIERAYEQTAAAMARATAAEAWLEKLDDTIVNCFGRLSLRNRQS